MIKKSCFNLNIQFLTLIFQILLIFLCLIFTSFSSAKIHIEPYVGLSFTYTNSKPFIKQHLSAKKTFNHLKEGRYYSGLTSGMRIGYSYLGLAVGGDFSAGHWVSLYKENFIPFQNQERLNPVLLGLFVSYKLPMFFRIYATLFPQTIVHFSSQETSSKYCTSSRGAKLGISYLSLPFLSINFEYLPLYIHGSNCSSWSHTGTVYANFIF